MLSHGNGKIGRNDPCPCGSGKKFKRCCLRQHTAEHSIWARQKDESEELTTAIVGYARDYFEDFVADAWKDFHLGKVSKPFSWTADEQMIFMPYFLFHWDPECAGKRKRKLAGGGVVAQAFLYTNGHRLTELQRSTLQQAMGQPVSFYQVLATVPGKSFRLGDVLTGSQCEVKEHLASQQAKVGDLLYGSVWALPGITILGYSAPIKIPLSWKAEIIGLRSMLRRRVARHNRSLNAQDLLLYADEIRATYLLIRDSFNRPPRFSNTDGEPIVFHTLTFQIQSAEAALDALAPLAEGRSKEELVEDAEFDDTGKLKSVAFDWLKKGNSKMASWDNTILGSVKIDEHSLVAEVNSEQRAKRLRDEIETRLGAAASHVSTVAHTLDEMLAKSPKHNRIADRSDEESVAELLRDPEVQKQIQDRVQRDVEAWIYQKIPALGGRTPLQAVRNPDGREIVESLLLDWERRTEEGLYQPEIRPDFNVVRKLLKLTPIES